MHHDPETVSGYKLLTILKVQKMKSRFSLVLMAFVAATMLFSSCKKDDSELILGTWNLNGEKSYMSWTYGQSSETENMSDVKGTFTFKSDGTVVIASEDEGEPEEVTGSYTLAEGKLTITEPSEGSQIFNIEKLTKSDLIIGQSESQVIDGQEYSMTIHMEFTR